LALLDDPTGLLDLLGDRRPHLVEDVVDLLAVDAHLVREGDGLRVVHEVVELVDQNEDVHGSKDSFADRPDGAPVGGRPHSGGFSGAPGLPAGNTSLKRRATGSGTRAETSPPNAAISFTPLEETKLT